MHCIFSTLQHYWGIWEHGWAILIFQGASSAALIKLSTYWPTISLLICNLLWILKNLDSVCFSWGQHEITNSREERNTIAGQIPTTPLHYPLIKISGCNLLSLGQTKAAPMLLSAIRLETTVERLETTVERHVTFNLKDNKFFKSPTSTSKNCFQSLCLRENTKSWDGWYPGLHCVLQAKSHF